MKARLALGLIVAFAIATVVGLGLHRSVQATKGPAEGDRTPRAALAVTTVAPVVEEWPRVIETSGGLYPWQEAVIAAETGGLRVVEVAVEIGDQVHRGQVLAQLAQDTVKAELAQREANLAQVRAGLAEAKANADRARHVEGKSAMSEQQINQYLIAEQAAKANLAAAEASLEMQKIRLAQTLILAVDDGVISARNATLGMVVQTGTELFRIVRQGRIEWRAEVTAHQLAQIRTGLDAEIELPNGEQIVGRVRMPAPTLDSNTRYALVYVDVPVGSPVRAGMFARGRIRLAVSPALTLPESAVVPRDGNSYVFEVVAGDRVAQRKVLTGRRARNRIEINEGLDTGARVVASGGAFLNDGDLVRVEPGSFPAGDRVTTGDMARAGQ